MAHPHPHNTRLAAQQQLQLRVSAPQDENALPTAAVAAAKSTVLAVSSAATAVAATASSSAPLVPSAKPLSGTRRLPLGEITNTLSQQGVPTQQCPVAAPLAVQPPAAKPDQPAPPSLFQEDEDDDDDDDDDDEMDMISEDGLQDGQDDSIDTMEIDTVLASAIPTSSQSAPPLVDIDSPTRTTAEHLAEYCAIIMANLKLNEAKHLPPQRYLSRNPNPDINPSMRAILVDWFVEVIQEYNLSGQTLCLAVNYTDRLLNAVPVARQRLQLVGITAMLVAAKFFEVVPPTVEDCVYITDNTYSKAQLLSMEAILLNKLQFNLVAVTYFDFLPRYLDAAEATPTVRSLAAYISELTLQEYNLVGFKPSEIATCSVILALHTARYPPWTPTLAHYTGYTPQQLAQCLRIMFDMYRASPGSPHGAMREKFSHSNFHRVSFITPPASLPVFSL